MKDMVKEYWNLTDGVTVSSDHMVDILTTAVDKIHTLATARDSSVPDFLLAHYIRSGSLESAALYESMKQANIQMEVKNVIRVAKNHSDGMYGFSQKTTKVGLEACSAVKVAASQIAGNHECHDRTTKTANSCPFRALLFGP